MDQDSANSLMGWINNISVLGTDLVGTTISIRQSKRGDEMFIAPGELWWEAYLVNRNGEEINHCWLGKVTNNLSYENGKWVEV